MVRGEVLPEALVPVLRGSVSSDDLHGLSRVPFVGVVDVFSRLLFELQLLYSKMVLSYGCFVFT